VAAQAARALAYGLGSVLIGVTLARRGYSDAAVGAILAALLAGNALASVLLARHGDHFGRRRSYRLLFVLMALAGTVFALTGWLPALIAAALTGTLSTDVVESGPFTSLEQAMLPHTAEGRDPTPLFGTYNTVATLAGSAGALIALVGSSPGLLLLYAIAAAAGLVFIRDLSAAVEVGHELTPEPRPPLHRSRGIVARLSGLFALDSLGGGFVPQTFIAYLFTRKYDASPETLALLFFAIGLLQAFSFQPPSASPPASACCARWSSRTCPPTSCSPPSPSRPAWAPQSRSFSPASPSPRWTSPPGRPTSSPSSTPANEPLRPPTPTPRAP